MGLIFRNIELPSNRKFGFFFTLVFAISGLYFWYNSSAILSFILGSLSVLVLTVTLVNSALLLPANKLWMGFGFVIGLIVSPIVLGIIFFGIFTPISLISRAFGRDELRLKFARQSTYWRKKPTANEAPIIDFEKQF